MSKVILMSVVALFALSAQPVFAHEGMHDGASEGMNMMGSTTMDHDAMVAQDIAHKEAVAPVEVGNKLCPVSGEKVGEHGPAVKHEYKGKIYNLCCGMCTKDFNKDPEKYSKIAEDEVAVSAKK